MVGPVQSVAVRLNTLGDYLPCGVLETRCAAGNQLFALSPPLPSPPMPSFPGKKRAALTYKLDTTEFTISPPSLPVELIGPALNFNPHTIAIAVGLCPPVLAKSFSWIVFFFILLLQRKRHSPFSLSLASLLAERLSPPVNCCA